MFIPIMISIYQYHVLPEECISLTLFCHLSIVHHFREVLLITSGIPRKLLEIGSSGSTNTCSFVC